MMKSIDARFGEKCAIDADLPNDLMVIKLKKRVALLQADVGHDQNF